MSVKLIYLSAERKNDFLRQEIRNGLQVITREAQECEFSNQITVTSIFLKADNVNGNNEESTVIESTYSLDEKIDVQLGKENAFDGSEEELHMNDFFKLAEYLHSFADVNLESGRTSVHFLWCVKNYIPCPSEVVEFYGAFERLRKWYNGSLNVITNNIDAIEDWLSFLPIKIVNSSEEIILDILSTVWRGSLAFSLEGSSGLTLFPDIVLQCENKRSDIFSLSGLKNTMQPLYVLPVAEVFSEIDLDSIPLAYIQSGSLCSLMPSPQLCNEKREEVMGILNTLSSAAGVGILFRIRFSVKPPSLKGLETTNTQTWKQMIAEGNFNLSPGFTFEGCHDVAVFLILPKKSDVESIKCLALQDPTNYDESIVKLILEEQLKSPVENEVQKKKILDLVSETLALSQLQTDAFSHLLISLPSIIKKRLDKFVKTKLPKESLLALECITSKTILSYPDLRPNTKIKLHPPTDVILSETRMPKECWPEFRALEEAEKKKKNSILRCTSGDFLGGLSPPAPSQKDNYIDSSQLLESYYKFWGAKQQAKRPSKFISGRSGSTFDWLKNMSWREALHLKYPGIYYNLGKQQEKLDSMCNRLREQMFRYETASTCTLFSHHRHVERKNRKKEDGKGQYLPKPSTRKQSGEADSCSITSSLRSFHLRTKNGPSKQTLCKKPEVQLRRSPRKRMKQVPKEELKPSDLLSKKSVKPEGRKSPVDSRRRNPKPAELSEIHKQKLRNAILSCLENEGVTIKDPVFKLCFKKLFAVCKPFALDVASQGGTKRSFEKIAKSHVKQVVQFEKRKNKRKVK